MDIKDIVFDDETSTLTFEVQETFCETCQTWTPTSKWKGDECPKCVKEEIKSNE